MIGVSFHVGSGCRNADRYQASLKDARGTFDMAKRDFGFEMTLLHIGSGFPGETHSTWNPVVLHDTEDEDYDSDEDHEQDQHICLKMNNETSSDSDDNYDHHPTHDNDNHNDNKEEENDRFMFYTEIADKVRPMVDELFLESSDVRLIAEPGHYFVASKGLIILKRIIFL